MLHTDLSTEIHMTIRSKASRLLAVAVLGLGLASAPVIAAAPALAAPCPGGNIADPVTGVCWSQSQGSIGITGTGGVCLPGRLGLCLGALQNSQIPGANLPPKPVSTPGSGRSSWP